MWPFSQAAIRGSLALAPLFLTEDSGIVVSIPSFSSFLYSLPTQPLRLLLMRSWPFKIPEEAVEYRKFTHF
jgi:hypothetical protein